ncbi:dihydrofolate reductase family protein [Cellulosimicrobium sp. PMB13]|uniref:dihydrofolate reductase family protein n=1 Tax=Cellulosimicrobium sp. PMB13 TaxID=3120158 RepID=UPI003F4BABF7
MTSATTPPSTPHAPPTADASPGGRDDLPPLDVLLPAPRRLDPDPREDALAALYADEPPSRGPWTVRANMVTSIDGAAWGPDQRSGSINDDADWRVFRVLRALADVVLVGAGTARAEGYTALGRPRGLTHLRAAPLELALVSRTGHVPERLVAADRPPFVLTAAAGADAARSVLPDDRVVVVGDAQVDLAAGLQVLADLGLRRVLTEGGPTLLGALLRADLVDELCVTTTPGIVGPGPGRIVAGDVPAGPQQGVPVLPRGARLAHLLHSPHARPGAPAGTTIARWLLPIG